MPGLRPSMRGENSTLYKDITATLLFLYLIQGHSPDIFVEKQFKKIKKRGIALTSKKDRHFTRLTIKNTFSES
jgi:hypothetical protein